MKLYMKQHIFTIGDRFSIYDIDGEVIYEVEGEVFTFGDKLHIYDRFGNEVARIEQELFSFLRTYRVIRGESEVATIRKEFTFFTDSYSILGPEMTVEGDFFDRTYDIFDASGHVLARIDREWFTLGDAYVIDIDDGQDTVNILAIALAIDAAISARRS